MMHLLASTRSKCLTTEDTVGFFIYNRSLVIEKKLHQMRLFLKLEQLVI